MCRQAGHSIFAHSRLPKAFGGLRGKFCQRQNLNPLKYYGLPAFARTHEQCDRNLLIVLFSIFLLLYFLWGKPVSSAHALDVPKVQGYVNDYADMISPSVKAELENELKTFEQTDSTQIVILTIPSLEGEEIEDFGIKVGDTWKIGQAGKDNGIIFIVAKQDRKMRIEVGRGLEGG